MIASIQNNNLSKPMYTAEQLEELAVKYPYCSILQFDLLVHYTRTNDDKAGKQAEKTALFFTNTEWLNWQLEQSLDQAKVEPSNSSNEPHDPVIEFEPLHTVDYFASQGIKVTEDNIGGDKLGKQLKSFTEWLKSMKKVHITPLDERTEAADLNIREFAEVSNNTEEVITEAMAEVLQKQGKPDKALEIYNKLSLINPAKSAYFAAKIESLKAP